MLASLTLALGLAVAPQGADGPDAFMPPPLPANPVAGLRIPARPGPVGVTPGYAHHGHLDGGFILPPGPGNGYGFPNGRPDGYGWYDPGDRLPIREDRTTSYYFRRYMSVPPQTLFMPTYYNPFVTRGQRFVPYIGCGGFHSAGGPPSGPANLPVTPYSDIAQSQPLQPVPAFSGEVQATPITPGEGEDMIP